MLRSLCFIVARDPVVIERSNLVNISKLIVKELIEQSLRYGRMLDSDHLPLHHFFIVLEHVMRHGLKPKKVGNISTGIFQKITRDNNELAKLWWFIAVSCCLLINTY